MKKILFLFFLIYCNFSSLYSIEIKHLREFTLFQNDEEGLYNPGSFFITEDDLVFVFDGKASNIKIFNTNGELVRVFGKRGVGPDEFSRPFFSAYKNPFVVFADFGRKHFFIYKRIGKNNLTFKKKFLSIRMASDFHIINDRKLMISGYKMSKKGKAYSLYLYDYKNNKYDFLLPVETSYGYNSYGKYKKEYGEKIVYIGPSKFCDWKDDIIYHVWVGDIKIIKLNRKTSEMTFFGKKTENYIQPHVTPKLKKAYDLRKAMIIRNLKAEMSYIRDLFVLNSKKVGLVYVGPLKKNKGINVMLQLYDSSGKFIKEFEILNAKASTPYEVCFYFRKDKNLFYILDTETSKEFDQFFKIHTYKIKDS